MEVKFIIIITVALFFIALVQLMKIYDLAAKVRGGKSQEKISRSEYFKAFYPINIMGQTWRAISWTTAASLVSVIEMINEGLLKKEGFIKQEEIPFDKFLKTDSGKLFLD